MILRKVEDNHPPHLLKNYLETGQPVFFTKLAPHTVKNVRKQALSGPVSLSRSRAIFGQKISSQLRTAPDESISKTWYKSFRRYIAMNRELLVITALQCEAAPFIEAWQLKPLRENLIGERFQVFSNGAVYVAVSGVGKVKSAIATSSIITGILNSRSSPIVANVGIAGACSTDYRIGDVLYVHKVRDVATNTRLYPDVLLRHNLPEVALETHDSPVINPPSAQHIVDMEGFGFLQAALAFYAPSQICLLKVVSDHCKGESLTKQVVESYISRNMPVITDLLTHLRTNLPEPERLHTAELELLDAVCAHATFSLSQRIELRRVVESLHAQKIHFKEILDATLSSPVSSKEARNRLYHDLLRTLRSEVVI